MPDIHTLALFAVASAALVAVPGPAVLYIVSRGLAHGRRGGLLSMLGIETGNFVHRTTSWSATRRPALRPATVLLGTLFVVIAAIGDTLFALLAGTAGERFRARLAAGGSLRRVSGGILVALGVWAALAEGDAAGD